VFPVSEPLREYTPASAARAAICPRCLRLASAEPTATDSVDATTAEPTTTDGADATVAESADDPSDATFERVDRSIPAGEGGIAVAVLLGLLPSLTLERDAVTAVRDHAERASVDVTLTLERLRDADGVAPHFDLDRRIVQMEQLL
jgi:hypothetical protein